jgi:nucleotide-binding universal stress UspA family protein
MRVLVPIDGSPRSLIALRYVIDRLAHKVPDLEIRLLNVQAPLPAVATGFVAGDVLKGFHQEEGGKALAAGRALLAGSGLPHQERIVVGETAPSIVDQAREQDCDQIVMSPRGRSAMAGLLLGSTAHKVIGLSRIPVTIVPLP